MLDFGCKEFHDISENISRDEGKPKEDEEDLYSPADVTANLRKAAHLARQADQPELVPKFLRLVTPLVERDFDYGNLAELFGEMKIAAEESNEFLSKKRFLGKYYRVAFYGSHWEDDQSKIFIYKGKVQTLLSCLTFPLAHVTDQHVLRKKNDLRNFKEKEQFLLVSR